MNSLSQLLQRSWLWAVLAAVVVLGVVLVGRNRAERDPAGGGGADDRIEPGPAGTDRTPSRHAGTDEQLRDLLVGKREAAEYRSWAKAAVRKDPEGAWRAALALAPKSRAEYFAQLLLTELAGFDDETLERLIAAGDFGEVNVRELLKSGLGHQHARKVGLRLWENSADPVVRQGLLLAFTQFDAHLAREKLAAMKSTNADSILYKAVAAALVRENLTEALAWARTRKGWQADAVWGEIGSSLRSQLGAARPIKSLEPLLKTLPVDRQFATFERILEGGVTGPKEDFPAFWSLAVAVRAQDRERARCLVLKKYGDDIELVQEHVVPASLPSAELAALSAAYAVASPTLAFTWAQGIENSSASELASARVLRSWLGEDSQAAGQRVLEMEAGRERDLLAGEVIRHLAGKKSFEEARDWISYVGDSELREEFAALLER